MSGKAGTDPLAERCPWCGSNDRATRKTRADLGVRCGNEMWHAGTDPLAEDVEALGNLIPLGFDPVRDGVTNVHEAARRILASKWLAAHDAEVRVDERRRVAALLADEATVERVAGALKGYLPTQAADLLAQPAARAVIAAITE